MLEKKQEVFNDLVKTMSFNYDESLKKMDEFLLKYKNLVFTESEIADAKVKKSEIDAVVKNLEVIRKNVKSQWQEPLNDFELKIKSLETKANETLNLIKNQIDEFDNKRLKEKKDKIQSFLTIANAPFQDKFVIELNKIYNPRWDNKTYKLEDIEKEIKEIVARIEKEYISCDNNDVLLLTYKNNNYDIKYVYEKKEEIKKILEENKKKEEVKNEEIKKEEVKNEEIKKEEVKNDGIKKYKYFKMTTNNTNNQEILIFQKNIELSKKDFLDIRVGILEYINNFIKERGLNEK